MYGKVCISQMSSLRKSRKWTLLWLGNQINKQNRNSTSEQPGVDGLGKVEGLREDNHLQKWNKSWGVCSQVWSWQLGSIRILSHFPGLVGRQLKHVALFSWWGGSWEHPPTDTTHHWLWSRRLGKRGRAVPGGRRGTVLPLTLPVLLLYPRKRLEREKGLEKRTIDPGRLEATGSSPRGCRNTWGGHIYRTVTPFPGDPISARLEQKYIIRHFWELHSPNPQRPWRGSAQCTPWLGYPVVCQPSAPEGQDDLGQKGKHLCLAVLGGQLGETWWTKCMWGSPEVKEFKQGNLGWRLQGRILPRSFRVLERSSSCWLEGWRAHCLAGFRPGADLCAPRFLHSFLSAPPPSSKPAILHCVFLTLQLSLTSLSSAAGESFLLPSTHVLRSDPIE